MVKQPRLIRNIVRLKILSSNNLFIWNQKFTTHQNVCNGNKSLPKFIVIAITDCWKGIKICVDAIIIVWIKS